MQKYAVENWVNGKHNGYWVNLQIFSKSLCKTPIMKTKKNDKIKLIVQL